MESGGGMNVHEMGVGQTRRRKLHPSDVEWRGRLHVVWRAGDVTGEWEHGDDGSGHGCDKLQQQRATAAGVQCGPARPWDTRRVLAR